MQSIRDVMSDDLTTVSPQASVADAGMAMRQNDIGDVMVVEGDRFVGLLTDRDIVVRAVAEGRDPTTSRVQDVVTTDVLTLTPDATVDEAAQLMRDAAVRRVPVVEGDRPVGIVSIGDLAVQQDPNSALAEISEAEPNV
jgi:CBS domain-containing protein